MKKSLVGHMVKISKNATGYGSGFRGEVVAMAREGNGIDYIVQFLKPKVCWCYYKAKELKIDE